MTIRSKGSNVMAVATANLIVQLPQDAVGDSDVVLSFENAIDETVGLRRRGRAVMLRMDSLSELRCDVTYGPIIGAFERRLRRRLGDIAERIEAAHFAVFDFVRRELTSQDLEASIAELEGEIASSLLSLSARERWSKTLGQLRQQLERTLPDNSPSDEQTQDSK